MVKIKYNINDHNFADVVSRWFQANNLSKIHENTEKYNVFDRENDNSTQWHKIYYDKINEDAEFSFIYLKFINNYVKPLYNEKVVFQKKPNIRVHLPHNVAVGEYHKDKDYRDKEWCEHVKELNYYLPLTSTNEQNTIWMESEEDKKDYKPAILNYGECLQWDGSNLSHGNKLNSSKYTRVSIDFRVIPLSRYIESDKGSINTKTQFKLGEYYSIL